MKLTTLSDAIRLPLGNYTVTVQYTISTILTELLLKDNPLNDTTEQKQIRDSIKNPPQTEDDKLFTIQEIKIILNEINTKKDPEKDRITGKMCKFTFKAIQMLLSFFSTSV